MARCPNCNSEVEESRLLKAELSFVCEHCKEGYVQGLKEGVTADSNPFDSVAGRGKLFAKIGLFMQLGPVFGLAVTALAMIRAFQEIAKDGMGKPEFLAGQINDALVATAVGMVLGLVGMVFMCISLIGYKFRASWFFRWIVFFSLIWLLSFPVGTAVGLFFLIYVFSRKKEFFLS